MTSEEKQNLVSLVQHHLAEFKNYAARSGQCDNPTAAQWLSDMADKHRTWADAVDKLLRESEKGETDFASSIPKQTDSRN